MYKRTLDLDPVLQHKSLFLLGPRQVGKSTLLRERYPKAKYIDLLHADTFRRLSFSPELLRQELKEQETLVIIDEIQKLPSLLDEVHGLIERNKKLRFILTGSSARKLRRSGVNLLGGRARELRLFPLTVMEAGISNLRMLLTNGGLPSIITSPQAQADLRDYVGLYLQEEIRSEALVRSIEAYSRFFSVAAQCNTQQVNFTEVGNDAQVPPRTVREYFQLLEDTLVGYQLPAYQKTTKRKPVAVAKFYLFDIGIAHALQGITSVLPHTESYGRAVEHLVFLELHSYLNYTQVQLPLSYWRSRSKMEVDFIIGDEVGIEVKSTGLVSNRDLKGLQALAEEVSLKRKIIVSNDTVRRVIEGIEVIPLTEFIQELWEGGIIA